jgi:preprotein translocase subunit YajC
MFIHPAFAADNPVAAMAADAQSGGTMTTMLFMFVFAAIFYFLVIRPQSQRIREHRSLIDGLKKGDKVVTGGGVVATVVKAPEKSEEIVVRISDGVDVTVLRNTILSLHGASEKPEKEKK